MKPLDGQSVHHGFRQSFGSRRLLLEIFNLAHDVTLGGDNCLAPKVLQSKPMQGLLCELGHAVPISCDRGSLPIKTGSIEQLAELIRQ